MNTSKKLFGILFIGLFLFSACSNDDDDDGIDCDAFEWSYVGDSDPEVWSVCNADCGGNAQSPINISNAELDSSLEDLNTNYQGVPIDLINNGHTVEFNYGSGSTVLLDGVEYDLLQFHFHTLSEHTVNGNHYPMEAHLVHQNESTGNIVVIGVFFEVGEENTFLANFSNNYPAQKDDVYQNPNNINVVDLLPTAMAYYAYSGSLTTPPCSETVSWFVMKNPVEASSAQINDMHNILNDNYRPTQELNGRSVSEFN